MAPLQSAVTSTSVVNGSQLESGGIINQGTGANIAAVTTTAWAWERRNDLVNNRCAAFMQLMFRVIALNQSSGQTTKS